MEELKRIEALNRLREAIQEGLAEQKPRPGMGPRIQDLYDALTPLALLIRETQEDPDTAGVATSLAIGFSAIIRNADNLAVAGLVMDLLWKVADKEGS